MAARLAIEDFGGQVLGKPITIISGDEQNKPDIAANLARQFYDRDNVTAVVDGGSSSTALAIQFVSTERKKIFLVSGGTTAEITGKSCSPYSIHWLPDTHAISTAATRAVVAGGGTSWFYITANYVFGQDLEKYSSEVVKAAGGTVLGSARAPLNTADFSSFLLQAQSSGANVIAFANAGSDTQNAIKQAQEFGLGGPGSKLKIVGLDIFTSDIQSIGLPASQGVIGVADFYWDMDDTTRAWSKRFKAVHGKIPTYYQADSYSAVYHYLAAVKAAGTTDPDKVSAMMYATPLSDPLHKGVKIRKDGRVMQPIYLMEVKTPQESKGPDDIMKVVSKIAAEDAFIPLEQTGCQRALN
ncbi:MAG: transporter permease [Tardiphaga sp.]|nr:transporter permease [Tardiphaga sp.]